MGRARHVCMYSQPGVARIEATQKIATMHNVAQSLSQPPGVWSACRWSSLFLFITRLFWPPTKHRSHNSSRTRKPTLADFYMRGIAWYWTSQGGKTLYDKGRCDEQGCSSKQQERKIEQEQASSKYAIPVYYNTDASQLPGVYSNVPSTPPMTASFSTSSSLEGIFC